MQDHPEVFISNAKDRFHRKGALIQVATKRQPLILEARLFVGANSKWMRIDAFVGVENGIPLVRPLVIDQEIAGSIVPAPKEVQDFYEGRIAFVVRKVLPPFPE
jgi:hypothetical protein